LLRQRINHLISRVTLPGLDTDCLIDGMEMIRKGADRSLFGIGFLVGRTCRRPGYRPPMVEDPWNMANPGRSSTCRTADTEIIILAPLETTPETADVPHQRCPVNSKMTDIILR